MGANIILGGTDKQYYIISYLKGLGQLGTGYSLLIFVHMNLVAL